MKVLVAYASRLGSTKAIAERIAARLEGDGLDATAQAVERVDDVWPYDAFVIGSAVYAGHWLKEAVSFVSHKGVQLSEHPVWLFSSGPVGQWGSTAAPVRPWEVDDVQAATFAREHRTFAGALDRTAIDGADLNLAERFVAGHLVPEGDFRDWLRIDAWADEIANELAAAPAGGL